MTDAAPREADLTRLGQSYWAESCRPLASLAFTAPLLIVYEGGVLLLRDHATRNGADAWMRQWLDMLGFSQYFLLPILTVAILLGWHHVSRQPWRLSRGVLWGMAGECAALSVGLWLLLRMHSFLMQSVVAALQLSVLGRLGTVTAYLGAGIYEELLFRLILLALLIALARAMHAGPRWSRIGGIFVASLLFAAAHHVGQYGEPFVWSLFQFRFLAGVFFAVIFLYRGFGIAAGTHAGYDVLIALTTSIGC